MRCYSQHKCSGNGGRYRDVLQMFCKRQTKGYDVHLGIIGFFGHCKGGTFNFHMCAVRLFNLLRKEKSGFVIR